MPRDTEVLVIDAPARTHGSEMNELVRRAETILVPVLPSPIDMKACAHFMGELLELGKVQRTSRRAARRGESRAREHADVRGARRVPAQAQGAVPGGASARSQNYLRAFQRGMGIFELPEYLAWPDWKQWEPVTKWLGLPPLAAEGLLAGATTLRMQTGGGAISAGASGLDVAHEPQPRAKRELRALLLAERHQQPAVQRVRRGIGGQ